MHARTTLVIAATCLAQLTAQGYATDFEALMPAPPAR